jgi:hypothetical protein
MRKCLVRTAWSSLVQLSSRRTETAKSSDRLMTLSVSQTHGSTHRYRCTPATHHTRSGQGWQLRSRTDWDNNRFPEKLTSDQHLPQSRDRQRELQLVFD